jgi:hypothetical protein
MMWGISDFTLLVCSSPPAPLQTSRVCRVAPVECFWPLTKNDNDPQGRTAELKAGEDPEEIQEGILRGSLRQITKKIGVAVRV